MLDRSINYITTSLLVLLASCTSTNSLLKKGAQQEKNFFIKKAETSYTRALQKSPGESRCYLNLARIYMRTERHGKALLLLRKASSLPNTTPQLWDLLSKTYLRAGKYKKASFAAEKGLSLFPYNPLLLKLRNRINFELFANGCQNKIKSAPKRTQYRKLLAFSLLNRGFDNLAIIEFEKILSLERNNSELLLLLGNHFYKTKNYAKAKNYYTRVLRYNAKNSGVLNALGEIALQNGYLWQAYRYFFRSAMYSPNNGKAFEKIGFMAVQMGKKEEALKFLTRAVALGVKNAQIFSRLGHLLLASKDEKEQVKAHRYFEKAENYLPPQKQSMVIKAMLIKKINRLKQFLSFFAGNIRKEAEIHFQLANCYLKLKQYKIAYIHIQKAHRNQPNFFRYLLCKGRIEYALQMLERCIKSFNKCLSINPDNKPLYLHLAKIYHKGPLQNEDKYIDLLQKGRELNGPSPTFNKLLGEHYIQKGKKEKALRYFLLAYKEGVPIRKTVVALKQYLQKKRLHADGESASSAPDLLIIAQKFRAIEGNGSPSHIKYLQKAIKTEEASNDAGYHTLLGEAYAAGFFREMRYSLLQKANAHLKTALKLNPRHTDALSILTQLSLFDWMTAKKTDKLIKKWSKIDILTDPYLIKDKRDLRKHLPMILSSRFFSIGKIMYNKHKDFSAADYLKKALQLSKDEALAITVALGAIYREKHSYKKAAMFYKALLKMRNKPAHKQYAVLLLLLGNLYATIAENLPYTPAFFAHNFSKNNQIDSKTLTAIGQQISSAKKNAITYYRAYINNSGQIFTHRTKCREKIRKLNNISTAPSAIYQRIATIFYNNGNRKKAARLLTMAIKQEHKQKKQKPLYLFLAKILAETGQTQQLKITYNVILKKYPNDWRNYFNFAKFLFSKGEIKAAITNFEKSSKLNRYDADIKSILGFLHWKQGNTKKANQYLTKAANIDKENLNAHYYMSKIMLEAGNLKKAIKHGEKVVSLFKGNLPKYYGNHQKKSIFLDALSLLARTSFYRKNIFKCLKYAYEGASFDTTDKYHFQAMIGDIFFLQKKYPQAEQYYKKAVKLNKNIALFQYKLAQTYLKNQKTLQAKRLLEKLYKNNKQFVHRSDLHLVLASFYKKIKNLELSKEVLNNLIEEFPHLESGYVALAEQLKNSGSRTKAQQILERGLSIIKTAPTIRDALAWLLVEKQGKQERLRALHLARENASSHPANTHYRATLSYIYFQLGQFSHSRSLFPNMKNSAARRTIFEKMICMDNAVTLFKAGKYKKAIDLIFYNIPGNAQKKSLYTARLFTHYITQKRIISLN